MKNFLFFILFLYSTTLSAQLELVCEYNPNWQYEWYHDGTFLGIKTNVLHSIGKNVSGEYKVVVTNKCDTTYQTINIKKPKDKNIYHLENINIDSCSQTLFDEEWYNELQSELSFIIFPNPTKNLLNFRVYRGNSSFYQITIYDQLGKKVIEKRLNGEDQIDITNITKGIYIFEVISEKTKKCEMLNVY